MRKLKSVVLVFMLSGCGFHPHGTNSIHSGLDQVKLITDDPYGPLARDLSRLLKANNITEVHDSEKDVPEIIINSVSEETVTLAVWKNVTASADGPVAGLSSEHQSAMNVNVTFYIPLLEKKTYSISDRVTLGATYRDSLAAETGSELYKKELTKRLADKIIRRFDNFSKQKKRSL